MPASSVTAVEVPDLYLSGRLNPVVTKCELVETVEAAVMGIVLVVEVVVDAVFEVVVVEDGLVAEIVTVVVDAVFEVVVVDDRLVAEIVEVMVEYEANISLREELSPCTTVDENGKIVDPVDDAKLESCLSFFRHFLKKFFIMN